MGYLFTNSASGYTYVAPALGVFVACVTEYRRRKAQRSYTDLEVLFSLQENENISAQNVQQIYRYTIA